MKLLELSFNPYSVGKLPVVKHIEYKMMRMQLFDPFDRGDEPKKHLDINCIYVERVNENVY
jgi:hypothetical protein